MAAEGGRVGWLSQGLVDRFQYTWEIAIHFVVPKPENTEAGLPKLSVTPSVTRLMCIEIVLTAIDFDDESMLEADEVDYEPFTRRLPAEVIAAVPP